MKTTEVIIEILIAGTLVTASLLFFLWSWFPKEVACFLEFWMARGGSLPGAVLAVVLGAIAY